MQNMIPTHNGLMRETELDRINLQAIKEYRLGNGSFIWEKVDGKEYKHGNSFIYYTKKHETTEVILKQLRIITIYSY